MFAAAEFHSERIIERLHRPAQRQASPCAILTYDA
jgi:hypothetical protein